MESILELAKTEARLFKGGSGTGSNLSNIRSAASENLTGGGTASGPVSFMRGFDAFAGVIKSGGKTRRAAKMVILNCDHPDILEFIDSKANEEKKAWALIEQGYDGSFTGEAYSSVYFQNANHSIRATDEFMRAAVEDKPWATRGHHGKAMGSLKGAKVLLEGGRGHAPVR
jgi:ribonucleoside-diphosphate reductase alpha chain